MNCSTNLKRIVQRLPNEMQHKWPEEADNLLRLGLDALFDTLIEFLGSYVSIATSCFGVLANGTKSDIDTTINFQRSTRRTHLKNMTTERSDKCIMQESSFHDLGEQSQKA